MRYALIMLLLVPYSFNRSNVVAGTKTVTTAITIAVIDRLTQLIGGSSVSYNADSDNIKLYPNPNNGQFSIEFVNPLQYEKAKIVITDLTGKQVYQGPVLKEEFLKQIDLSDIRAGIYVMMIKDKGILVTKKFIKN